MSKKISEYDPKELLLNADAIKNVTTEYEQWYEPENKRSKNKELTITLIVDIVLNLVALLPSFSLMHIALKVISIIILVALSIYCIICATRWYESYKEIKGLTQPQLNTLMMERAKESMKYTAIIRITHINSNDQALYLTDKEYFLPHCAMDQNLTIYDQKENIIQSLNDHFDIKRKHIIDVRPADENVHFSIKPIHERIQMNAFVFFDVTLKEKYKNNLTQQTSTRKWFSIEEMKNSTEAMSTNKDVIELLEKIPSPKESFVDLLGDIKIIWNITSKCSYNCSICATSDKRRTELSSSDKLKVLNHIYSAKSKIKNIDFAGGDPLQSEDARNIIQSAITQFGEEKISVTTTGQGLSKKTKDDLAKFVKRYEITIDASHENLNNSNVCETDVSYLSRNEVNYSENNINTINTLREDIDFLTINIPIINDDLSNEEIEKLISKIDWIKNHTSGIEIDVTLLRLMPVGKLADSIDVESYKKYNPINTVKSILEKIEPLGITCKLHCSLRILPEFNSCVELNHCEMLEHKIGVDCAGNVYACAWGAYLQNCSPTENPFYLGNLTKVSLIKILDGGVKSTKYPTIINEIESNNYHNYCSVVSYYINKTPYENHDPLTQHTK